MGLLVSVYHARTDCTNRGMSSGVADILVVNMEGPWEPEEKPDYPVAILTKNGANGPCIKPAVKDETTGEWVVAPGWWMNGGNLAATSDSRFGEAIRGMFKGCADFHGGLYIFDRKEF